MERNALMLVAVSKDAPKTLKEALELAERTGTALQVPPVALCLTVAGGSIEMESERWNDSK